MRLLTAAAMIEVLTGLVVLGAGAPCSAADLGALPVKAIAAPSSWSGLYVGLGLGLRATDDDVTTRAVRFDGDPRDLTNRLVAQPFNGAGFRAGLYAGYNWQVAPQWLVGVEGDVGFGSHSTTLPGFGQSPALGWSTFAADSFALTTNWDASLRARAGYLVTPSTLLYATGGVAWQSIDVTTRCVTLSCGATPPAVISQSATRPGATVGAGIETALWGNWLARAEYRYADYGTARFSQTKMVSGGRELVDDFDVRLRSHLATAGLTYKFGAPPSAAGSDAFALVAKAPPRARGWGGLYAGLGLGARTTQSDLVTTSEIEDGFAFDLIERANNRPFGGTAFRGNPYLGYNFQFAPQWIAGIEGDVGIASQSSTRDGSTTIRMADSQAPGEGLSVRTSWDASLRARLGYLVTPSTLLYATGGVAWQHVTFRSNCLSGICAEFSIQPAVVSQPATPIGGTLGAGLETMLGGNWLARAEYRYADFGRTSLNVARTGDGVLFTSSHAAYDLNLRSHAANFGLTYRFD